LLSITRWRKAKRPGPWLEPDPEPTSLSHFQQKATSVRRGEIFRLVAGGGGRRSPTKPVGDDAL
jgi:hypothetical protein